MCIYRHKYGIFEWLRGKLGQFLGRAGHERAGTSVKRKVGE
jgi:hypothetical protein